MKFDAEVKIGRHVLGAHSRTMIIGELSANHRNDIEVAKRSIIAMREGGADAVKVQTFTPESMTIDSDKSYFKIEHGTLWDGAKLYDLYKDASLPYEWHKPLQELAHRLGMEFFSSPFDTESADFLEALGVPAYKIASFEITDLPLIHHVAAKKKPVILSTGLATISEIEDAVSVCKEAGNTQVVLLKCTSSYPTTLDEINLRTLTDMGKRFGTIMGLSDHSEGGIVPTLAVSLGAKVVEKHFILDKSLGGPDASFSLDPTEFELMVKGVRDTETILGTVSYEHSERIQKNRKFMRSIFSTRSIKKGAPFTQENIKSVRPNYGLAPRYMNTILGKCAAQDIEAGTPITKNSVQE